MVIEPCFVSIMFDALCVNSLLEIENSAFCLTDSSSHQMNMTSPKGDSASRSVRQRDFRDFGLF